MNINKYYSKSGVIKNGVILLAVIISLTMLNGKAFSDNKTEAHTFTFVTDTIKDTLRKPLERLKNVSDLINLKYRDALNNDVEAQVSRTGFEWIFEAEGISLVKPVVNQEDGTVIVATTDIDFKVRVRNLLRRRKSVLVIGKPESKLIALNPNPKSNKGNKKWTFNIDGIVIAPPVLSGDDTFVTSIAGSVNLEGLDDLDLEGFLEGLDDLEGFLANLDDLANLDILDIGIKLTAINKNGRKKWKNPVEFDRAIPIGQLVAAPGLILATTFEIPTFSVKNTNIVDSLTGVVSAFDSKTGEENWVFNPAELDSEARLIVINTPTVDDSTIFINAISAISEKEINDFIEFIRDTILNVQNDIGTTITNSIIQLLDIFQSGGDIQPIVNNITEEVKLIINDTINNITNELPSVSSKLFALDSDGEIMWNSSFAGISVASPVVTDSGINVNSTDLSLGDISFDVKIDTNVTPEGVLKVDATINLLIAGTTINIGVNITLDTASAAPLDTLITEFDIPELNEILGTLNIFEGVSTTFNKTDGELIWQTKIGAPILLKPVTSGGQIIVATSSFNSNNESGNTGLTNPTSKIYSINTTNGETNWESDSFEGTIVSLLLGSEDDVFLSFINKGTLQFQALDSIDGSTKWANPFIPDNFVTSAPVINPNDGMVFLTASKIDLDNLGTSLKDLVPPLTGEIIGLDPSTGTIDKIIEVEGLLLTSPAIDKSRDAIYSVTSYIDIKLLRLKLNLLTNVNASSLK
ncbi:MAG: outer membrane protein assembly factor BamB family protein [Candidatus Anammoxibacter sp.]